MAKNKPMIHKVFDTLVESKLFYDPKTIRGKRSVLKWMCIKYVEIFLLEKYLADNCIDWRNDPDAYKTARDHLDNIALDFTEDHLVAVFMDAFLAEIKSGHIEDPASDGFTILEKNVRVGNLEMLKFLVQHGATVTQKARDIANDTKILFAIRDGETAASEKPEFADCRKSNAEILRFLKTCKV